MFDCAGNAGVMNFIAPISYLMSCTISYTIQTTIQVHDVVVDTDVVYYVVIRYRSMYATMSQHFHDYDIEHDVDYDIVVFCLRHRSSELRYCSIHDVPRSHRSSCLRYRRCYDVGNPDVVAPNYDIVVISAKTRYRETRYRSKTTISQVPTIQMVQHQAADLENRRPA